MVVIYTVVYAEIYQGGGERFANTITKSGPNHGPKTFPKFTFQKLE